MNDISVNFERNLLECYSQAMVTAMRHNWFKKLGNINNPTKIQVKNRIISYAVMLYCERYMIKYSKIECLDRSIHHGVKIGDYVVIGNCATRNDKAYLTKILKNRIKTLASYL